MKKLEDKEEEEKKRWGKKERSKTKKEEDHQSFCARSPRQFCQSVSLFVIALLHFHVHITSQLEQTLSNHCLWLPSTYPLANSSDVLMIQNI